MKKIYILIAMVFSFVVTNAQIAVTVTNPANTSPALQSSYTSFAGVLTDLNLVTAMTGPVTLTLAAGSETAPPTGLTLGSATLNPVMNATNTITIINTGGTATLNAGLGTATPGSAAPDGIFKLVGADYVTIDGVIFTDGNAANPGTMEYGLGLFKLSLSDGAQNNTIRNCVFNMQRINNATGSAPMPDGSSSILAVNSTPTAATTALVPTTAAGANSFNKIYSNTTNSGNNGIVFIGYSASTPFTAGDAGNDIGGSSAATGNTILNFGGAASAANAAAGIRVNNQYGGVNISYNNVNSNNGSGVNHASTLRGIYGQAGTSANATINSNTVSVKGGGTTSAVTAIENVIGSTAASNTVNVNNNIIQNCTYTTATTGTLTGILSGTTATTVNINNNRITGNNVGASGTAALAVFQGIYNNTTPVNLNTSSNTITSNSILNQGGTMYCMRLGTSLVTANSNNIANNSIPSTGGTSAATIYGIYDLSSPTQETFLANNINNLTIAGTSTSTSNLIGGIYLNTVSTSVKNIAGNVINGLSYSGVAAAGALVHGIYNASGNTISISKNKIYDLSAQGNNTGVYGINIISGITVTAFNNLIGDLRAPQGNFSVSAVGIAQGGGTTANLYSNTINLSGTSSATVFGTSCVYVSTTTGVLNMRNNILVNNSVAVGTGIVAAYRRSVSTSLANYASTSNNNDFYAGTPGPSNLIFYDGTNSDQTFAAYKARVTPRDAASISENPNFLSITGSAPDFLHINPAIGTQIESGGTAIAGVTDDFDGDVRNASTPDIGADEFAGIAVDLSAPTITFTPLGFTCTPGARTITATITDPSGVPTSGIGLPVLYWRINAGAYVAATGTFVSGNTYSFTFGTGATAGDVVSYYIAAQDNAPTPNVGTSPSTGAGGFSANPPAAATPPTTPASYSVSAPLSGTYSVGVGGSYTTLTAAVNAYNNSCLGGAVVFELRDATYPSETFPITISANPDASSVKTLTIKPASGVTASISGSAAVAILKLNGADFVTINGSNNGSTSKDLTLENTSAAGGNTIVWVASTATDAALNTAFVNCLIKGNAGTTTVSGILVGGNVFGTASDVQNNNLLIDNNTFTKMQNAVFALGNATTPDNNWTLTNNLVGSTVVADKLGFRGLAVQNAANFVISNNTILGITTATTSTSSAILAGSLLSGGRIEKNKISDIKNTNAGGYGANGILLNSSSTAANVLVANNFISDIAGYGYASGAAVGDNGYGIFINAGAGFRIYHNTVALNTNQTVAGIPAALNVAVGVTLAGAVDVQDNIFGSTQTTSGERYAIYSAAPNTVFSTINYNDYHTTGANLGFIGSSRSNLAAIQAGFGGNTNSLNVTPAFTSVTDLHLVATNPSNGPLDNTGTPLAAVTTDIDNATRSITTPDMGADEFTYIPPACPAPTAVTVSGIVFNGATVSFTGSGSFILEYGVTGFTPGTGAAAGAGGTIVSPAVSPQNITGLLPNTTYQVYVRQDCTGAGNGYSLNSTVVSFTTPVACPAPTAVSVTGITSTTATVNFTGSGSSYIIEYGPTAFVPGTGGTAGVGGTIVTASSSPYTLTLLSPTTAYDFYIRQNCTGAGNGYSLNTTKVSFTTLGAPPVNDEATGAITLTVGAACAGSPYSNVNATASANEPFPSCSGTKQSPVWFNFVAPASGSVRVSTDITAGTFTDSKLALFSAGIASNYNTFAIISCDDDGGSVNGSGFLSVLYATDLTPGTTYYVAVDKYSSSTTNGTFCIQVDELDATMLSTTNNCASTYQTPVSNSATGYTAQVPLLDAASKLVAIITNTGGASVSNFSAGQNINTGAIRTFPSGVSYLNRNFRIANTTATNIPVQLFFLPSELASLAVSDPTATLNNLKVVKQTENTAGCYNNFAAANGATTDLSTTGTAGNGVNWISFVSPNFSNFYIHSATTVVPVSLAYFRGAKQTAGNNLDWKIDCTSGLTITLERSADKVSFKGINTQNATADRCLTPFNYLDGSPLAGANYYRLKLTTPDGFVKYSNIVLLINKEKGFEFVNLIPNPVKNSSVLNMSSAKAGKVELSVTDISGKLVMKQSANVIAGSNALTLNFITLAAGTYQITAVNDDGDVQTLRFVKY